MSRLFGFEETTRGVTVHVQPSFLDEQSDPDASRFVWAYHIRLENRGELTVQLLDRHWTIVDGRGRREEVRGPGVVGAQPVLKPGEAYDYVSGCPLATPSGMMVGEYGFIDETGERFQVAIPPFSLDSPHGRARPN